MSLATKGAAIPAAPRKTLLEWIETDNGDEAISTPPACSAKVQAFHAQIAVITNMAGAREPLAPPPGLHLAPLG